jgi:hypothetical protein
MLQKGTFEAADVECAINHHHKKKIIIKKMGPQKDSTSQLLAIFFHPRIALTHYPLALTH